MNPPMVMMIQRAKEMDMERRMRERSLQAEARRRRHGLSHRQTGHWLHTLLTPIRRLAFGTA
jgi:hypothetical protein